MTTYSPERLEAERFLDVPRAHLHEARIGHPLAHIIRELRVTLGDLVGGLSLPHAATVVDFGCADMAYRDLFSDDAVYLGADLAGNAAADIEIASDGTLPLPDGTADVVFSSQVLEHVADASLYLSECARVLGPGGSLVLSTHGMMRYHRDPVDYWRWTGEGLRRVVAQAGLTTVRFVGVMGLASTGLQLFQDGTFHRIPIRLRRVYFAVMQGLVARFDCQSTESKAEDALVFALVATKRDDNSGGGR